PAPPPPRARLGFQQRDGCFRRGLNVGAGQRRRQIGQRRAAGVRGRRVGQPRGVRLGDAIRLLLRVQAQRGHDAQPPAPQLGGVQPRRQLLAHEHDKIGWEKRWGRCGNGRGRQRALRRQTGQHGDLAPPRQGRLREGVGRGIKGQRGQQRRLGRRQVADGFGEVGLGRGADAHGKLAVIGAVEMPGEQLRLAIAVDGLQRQQGRESLGQAGGGGVLAGERQVSGRGRAAGRQAGEQPGVCGRRVVKRQRGARGGAHAGGNGLRRRPGVGECERFQQDGRAPAVGVGRAPGVNLDRGGGCEGRRRLAQVGPGGQDRQAQERNAGDQPREEEQQCA
ncbi:hypothetical protein RZS08_06625, partial [Arthrospira platensis SPKY1]|nr:hypothetical protein [Arthrospira platensis SPKY1]